jgi:hypothetical protein
MPESSSADRKHQCGGTFPDFTSRDAAPKAHWFLMNKLVPTDRRAVQAPALTVLLDTYKAAFELMCIQFLSGGWKLAVRDSVMALYQARDTVDAQAREHLDDLLITDGETVRALLELADARGATELRFCESQLARLRRRHTELVHQLRRSLQAR